MKFLCLPLHLQSQKVFLGHPFSPQDFDMKLEHVDNLADFAIKDACGRCF